MTWYPMAFVPPQFVDSAGDPYSGAVIKSYTESTTTVISMATDSTGATRATSFALNASGYPESGGNVIIPHVQEDFKLALYPNQASADADSGAIWTYDNIKIADVQNTAFVQSFSGDGSTTSFTLSSDLGTDEKTIMVFADYLDEYSTNGTFAADSDWTKGTGWTIASGVATATAASGNLEQDAAILMIDNERYTVTYTVSNYSAGNVTVAIGGTSGTARSANGTYTETITCGTTQKIAFIPASSFAGDIDNVSVHRVNSAVRKILRPEEFTLTNTDLTFDVAPGSGTNNIIVFAPSLLFGAVGAAAAAAATSETNAATSETNAATSETNAATSETNAATSATNAATSETNAAASAAAAAASAAEGIYNNIITLTSADSPYVPSAAQEGTLFRLDCTSGNIVINLSTLATYGEDMKYAFARTDATANTATINAGGSDTINGSSSFNAAGQYIVYLMLGDLATTAWIGMTQSSSVTASNVSYDNTSVDLNSTTVQAAITELYNRSYKNVQDYGATGDGVTDDTSAIQTAINDAYGELLYFPEGIYLISSALSITDHIAFLGCSPTGSVLNKGSVIRISSATANIVTADTSSGTVAFINIEFDTSASRTAGNFLDITDCQNFIIHGCGFEKHYIAINFNDCLGGSITQCHFWDAVPSATVSGSGHILCSDTTRSDRIYIEGCHARLVNRSDVTASEPEFGIKMLYQDVAHVSGNNFVRSGKCLEIVPGSSQTASIIHAHNNSFDTSVDGVVVVPTSSGTAVRVRVDGNWIGVMSNDGCRIDGTNSTDVGEIEICNNIISNITRMGIIVTHANVDGVDILYNKVSACSNTGIKLETNATGIRVIGNIAGPWGTATGNAVGINIDGTVSAEVYDNDFSGNTTDTNLTASTTVWISNNQSMESMPYTPTLSAASGTFTTASASGELSRRGDSVWYRASITITTNGTAAGDIRLTTPYTIANSSVGSSYMTVAGTTGTAFFGGGGTTVFMKKYDSTYPGADGETIVVEGRYEV